MAIEKLTPEQEKQAASNLKTCQESIIQRNSQEAADALKKSIDAVNKLNQKAAKLPEDVIKNINASIKKLMRIINGWKDPSVPEEKAEDVIAELEKLLNPVVDSLCKIIDQIGLPEIPGLKDIADLLAALKKMTPPEKPDSWTGPWPTPGDRPEIPANYKALILDLLAAVQALATTLPLVCINILVNVVDLILSTGIPVVGMNFYTIIGLVPYVKQIPDLVTLLPKIVELMPNMSTKLKNAVDAKIKQQIKAIQDLSIPNAPTNVETPKSLPACPQRDK